MQCTSSSTLVPAPENLSSLTGSGRQAFLHDLSQHARLISIETSLGTGALVVQSFTGHEAMSELFRFDIDCIATSTNYELKALTGEEACLRLFLADGGVRAFHGVVTAARHLGDDGSLARYRLTLGPWLHALALRRDSYVFQNRTVLEIIEEVFKDYPNANYRFDVETELPKRSLTMQYRESDYDFVARLLAEEGLNFYIQHDSDEACHSSRQEHAAEQDVKAARARHCFVVFDCNGSLAPCMQPVVRFHRTDATESEDTVTLFSQRHQINANAVALDSWDYKTLAATSSEGRAQVTASDVPLMEIHEGAGAYRFSDTDESERIARARAESLGLLHQMACGESSVRSFAVGTWFELSGEAAYLPPSQQSDHQYVVLSISHRGSNNLPANTSGLLAYDHIEAGTYRNHFTCVRRATPIRPAYWFPKPTAAGAQVALVVGVADEEISTERNHRVKVQFPWQRGNRAAPGQLEHPAVSNAPGNESAGTWVRVAEPAAGANWGSHFIPRIDQEVLIDFIAGDIDRPIIIGQMYNGADTPPYHGADNHSGALSGIRTKEYAAGGFNQWAIDGTPGQLRQAVAASYCASQLNIGYLIRQNGNVRGTYRGTGFELATDAWGAIRAKRGMFISTALRQGAQSVQLDSHEMQEKLKAAAALAKALSDAAIQHRSMPLSTSGKTQQLCRAISGKELADGQQALCLEQPVILFDSQAAISMATPASSIALAGQDITMTSESALRITGGQTASIISAKTASIFTHSGGIKIIGAKEAVSARAHTGPMDMLADQAATITSSNGHIKIQAKQEILLASSGGYIKLAGANIDVHCPSSISVKGSTHGFLGASSITASLPQLPDSTIE